MYIPITPSCFMKKFLLKFIKSFLTTPVGEFPPTQRGFTSAKKWAKAQPHPYSENLSLWESLYSTIDDGWYVLHQINRYKKLHDAYQKCKDGKECNELTVKKLEREIF